MKIYCCMTETVAWLLSIKWRMSLVRGMNNSSWSDVDEYLISVENEICLYVTCM